VTKRSLFVFPLAALFAFTLIVPAGATPASYRPDAWIKLCGQSTGCVINPLPHPWLGNNVYNTSALHQTVPQRIDDGEGVRFWILFQNDGAQSDTFSVHGCTGNKNFIINAVIIGEYKVPVWAPKKHITEKFKANSAKFTLAPGKHIAITLNIVTRIPNVSYRCPVTITSAGDPTLKDTVAATMTTF
jgi:hypothetical protein